MLYVPLASAAMITAPLAVRQAVYGHYLPALALMATALLLAWLALVVLARKQPERFARAMASRFMCAIVAQRTVLLGVSSVILPIGLMGLLMLDVWQNPLTLVNATVGSFAFLAGLLALATQRIAATEQRRRSRA